MIKINKRKCRKLAIPDRKLQPDNGILHAKQIDYIVTTAIRNIAHHRTLILYIYPRDQASEGDYIPLWVIFQTKDDFITLSRKEDGSTTWRTASFENLGRDAYGFNNQYAFYSAQDEKRVQHYFKSDKDGFEALISVQDTILARRQRQRRIAKEKVIAARMEGIPALPCGLKSWIKSIMPAYFFYDYKRGNKNVQGVCSACGQEITLSGIKQGSKPVCPNCKHSLIAKPRSRRGYSKYDRDTFEVVQNMGDGRLVIRIIKAYFSYKSDIPDIDIYENIRQFISVDADGKLRLEHYYYAHNSGITTRWKKGIRPEYIMFQFQFEAGTCGHLYTRNLPKALANTPWQYCTITDFYHHFREPMQALPFLREYLKHPRLEHLCKVGFFDLVSDLVYGNTASCLDETQNHTHKILGIAAEDIPFLRDIGADLSILKTFRKYDGIKDRQRLLTWQLKYDVKHNILPILKYITVHKLIRYTERQFPLLCHHKDKYGSLRYKEMQDIVTEYRDYLDMCRDLNYDMQNSFVLYPKDLQKSHDRVQKRYKIKENELLIQNFKAAVQEARERFTFETDGMKIIVPATPGDLAAEGNALHHCVGGYAGRVAKKECVILFIRKCFDDSKPFYTMEVDRKGDIIQVRGMKNSQPTEEVEKFVDAFRRQVLQHPINSAA